MIQNFVNASENGKEYYLNNPYEFHDPQYIKFDFRKSFNGKLYYE